jgi:hypothetical protein
VGYLAGWSDRRGLVIKSTSSSITNYQMKLFVGESSLVGGANVSCAGLCTSDFRDLRFTSADGTTLLDYWIESVTGTTPNQLATIWVEFDFIDVVNTTFYMYYGNPTATAVSNGSNTFIFFDDFDSFDSNVWTKDESGGTVTYSNSVVSLDRTNGTVKIATKNSYGTKPFIIEAKYQRPSVYRNRMYNGTTAGGSAPSFDYGDFDSGIYWNGWRASVINNNTWYIVQWVDTNTSYDWNILSSSYSILSTNTTAAISGTGFISFMGTESGNSDLKFDWVRVRKAVSSEPIASWSITDYAAGINTNSYPYSRPLIVTEVTGQDRRNVLIRVYLNSTNFNFYYARQDGKDFRVAVGSNGGNVLNMFIANWDYANKKAYLMFKLPFLAARSTTILWAFWGNTNDVGISSLGSIGDLFTFYDDFTALDPSRWTMAGSYTITNSRLGLSSNASFQAKGNPLKGLTSFIVEEGIYASATTDPGSVAHAIYFYTGGEYTIEEHGHNSFGMKLYREGTVDRNHNAVDSVNYITYEGANKGFAGGTFNNLCVSYWEETDKIYQGLKARPNLSDYEDGWERSVLGNTDLEYFTLQSNDPSNYIDWIAVRNYDLDTAPLVNADSLYVEFQIIPPQPLDFAVYGDDLADTAYYHQTNISGADPYTMSDSLADNVTNIFESDTLTTLSGYVYIDFGRYEEDLSDEYLIHYDNNHVEYYNASKLSYEDDESGRNYWQCTTSSGVWAAIDFGNGYKKLGSLGVKAVSNNLNGMIKDFKFYGCHIKPTIAKATDKFVLKSGTFVKTSEWQSVYFANQTPYRYYILEATNSYGANVALQEWRLSEYALELKKRSVKQFRLHPASFESNDFYFPKSIQLHGSSNGIDWASIMSANTYTPFYDQTYGRWQVYSFGNPNAYYIYRLTCSGNWGGAPAQIKIGEWEFYEYASEINTHRVLDGTTNNIANVWLIDNVLYAANDKLSSIVDDGLAWSTTISGVADFIVRG